MHDGARRTLFDRFDLAVTRVYVEAAGLSSQRARERKFTEVDDWVVSDFPRSNFGRNGVVKRFQISGFDPGIESGEAQGGIKSQPRQDPRKDLRGL